MANRPKITRELNVWIFQGGLCAYCNIEMCLDGDEDFVKKRQATWDHVIPKSRGGLGLKRNRVLACNECNGDKSHLLLDEWKKSKHCPDCGRGFRLRTDCLRHIKDIHGRKVRRLGRSKGAYSTA